MRLGSRSLAPLALAVGIALVAPRAWADDRAAAQVLFEQGRDLVKRGSFKEACPKFAESLRLDRGIGTMLWLADCQENIGQTASAWATFKEAAAAAALAADPREKVARDRADVLVTKLARVTIKVKAPAPDLEVRRDGVVAGPAEWGVAVPIDPGPHTIEARAPGRAPWSITINVAATAPAIVVEVPALAADESAPATGPVGPTVPLPAPMPRPSEETGARADPHVGRTQRIVGVGVGALGVVGLGVGTFFSLHAKSTYDSSNEGGHCRADNRCDAVGTSARNDAKSEATVATIVLGVGLAALVGGVVLYLTAPRAAPSAVRWDGALRF